MGVDHSSNRGFATAEDEADAQAFMAILASGTYGVLFSSVTGLPARGYDGSDVEIATFVAGPDSKPERCVMVPRSMVDKLREPVDGANELVKGILGASALVYFSKKRSMPELPQVEINPALAPWLVSKPDGILGASEKGWKSFDSFSLKSEEEIAGELMEKIRGSRQEGDVSSKPKSEPAQADYNVTMGELAETLRSNGLGTVADSLSLKVEKLAQRRAEVAGHKPGNDEVASKGPEA